MYRPFTDRAADYTAQHYISTVTGLSLPIHNFSSFIISILSPHRHFLQIFYLHFLYFIPIFIFYFLRLTKCCTAQRTVPSAAAAQRTVPSAAAARLAVPSAASSDAASEIADLTSDSHVRLHNTCKEPT